MFLPVIAREILKYLFYEDKHMLSLLHSNFDFRSTFEFEIVEKYSCLISDWEAFKKDTVLAIRKELEINLHDFKTDNELTPIPNLKQVFYDFVSYVGCKPVLVHLLFCNRIFEKHSPCSRCTRIICRIPKHSTVLSHLDLVSVDYLIQDAPDDIKKVLQLMSCENLRSIPSLNCLINCAKLNRSAIGGGQENFSDINPLGANHPPLVFISFFTVASRISIRCRSSRLYIYE